MSRICLLLLEESSHTSDLNIDNPMAILPGAWFIESALELVGQVIAY